MDKKGAINLSVNMIIVLIIAIIVLGFALSFITGMFDRLEQDIDRGYRTIDVSPTRDSPIGIGETLTIGSGEERPIAVRVLNTADENITTGNVADPGTDPGDEDWQIACNRDTELNVVSASSGEIEPGDTSRVNIIIEAGSVTDNDICTISIQGVSTSFFVKEDR